MEFCRIADDVILGKNTSIHSFVNLYGCTIHDDVKIGAFVEIQKNSTVGKNCKISSHSFLCEGVTIEENVFIGHNVTFINDRFPRAVNEDGDLQTEEDWSVETTLVKAGTSIGSSVTIMCGVTIGSDALVGAGSVVIKNIPAGETWAGNPAKKIR